MKQTTIKLYEYDELNEEAKNKAFEEHEIFLRENPATYEDEDENGNITEKYDDMDEWSLKEIEAYVEDSIRINEYLFYSTGEMARTVYYTGKHARAGEHVLKIGKEEFNLQEVEEWMKQ